MMDYLEVMVFMKHFAAMNRRRMGEQIAGGAGLALGGMIETIHNFIDYEDFTIRELSTSHFTYVTAPGYFCRYLPPTNPD